MHTLASPFAQPRYGFGLDWKILKYSLNMKTKLYTITRLLYSDLIVVRFVKWITINIWLNIITIQFGAFLCRICYVCAGIVVRSLSPRSIGIKCYDTISPYRKGVALCSAHDPQLLSVKDWSVSVGVTHIGAGRGNPNLNIPMLFLD